MEKSTKYFFIFLALMILATVAFRYDQYVIKKNFVLNVATTCRAQEKNCFVMACTVGEDDCDKTPYKKVTIKDYEAPKCLEEHTCESFSCDPKWSTCSIANCAEDTIEDGEVCASATSSEASTTSTENN
jgi:hypothetical protein